MACCIYCLSFKRRARKKETEHKELANKIHTLSISFFDSRRSHGHSNPLKLKRSIEGASFLVENPAPPTHFKPFVAFFCARFAATKLQVIKMPPLGIKYTKNGGGSTECGQGKHNSLSENSFRHFPLTRLPRG